jgi:protease II
MLAIRSIRPKVRNLGRFHLSKFLSTGNSDSHYDQSPSEYVAFQRRENSLLKKFKSTNKAAILRAEDVISGCTSTAPADHSNPHTCGQYQYFSLSSDEDSTENSTIIYRQLRATVPSEDKCRGLEIEKIPVLDIDHLMTVVPNMVTVSRMKPSLDHSMIAFAIDLEDEVENEASSMTGQERDRSAFFIKDIRRNIICELDVSKAVAGAARQSIVDFEWSVSSNGKILMYLVLNDSLHRPHLVTEIDISMLSSEMFPANTDNNTDTASMRIFALETAHMKEILREEDIAFNVDVGRSKDDKYVIISCHSKTSSEVAVAPVPLPLPLIDPTDIASNGFITILQRQRGLKYYVDHCDGMFYVAANLPHGPLSPLSCTPPLHSSDELHTDLSIIGYPSARLMEFTAQSRSDGRIQSNFNGWETVFPTSIDRSNPKHENVSIRDFDIFQSKIVIYGRSCGYPTVRILDLHFSAACRGGSHVEDLTAAVRAAVGSDMFSMRADVGTALDSDTSHFTVSSPLVPGRVNATMQCIAL